MNFSQTLDAKGYAHTKLPFEVWVKIPSLAGKFVSITISSKKKRSNPQNRYYRGCIVPIFQIIYKGLGYDLTQEETHQVLKERFLSVDLIREDEVVGRRIKSTTELSTTEFIEYCERLQRYAAEVFDTYIPDAGEQVNLL